jgi:hypothetical protein
MGQLKPRWESVVAHDASQLLGAQQVAGAVVTRRGHGWQHAARATGGLVGEAMGYAAGQRYGRYTSQTPQFSRTAFVAVTEREVALIKYGPGSSNGKAGELLGRVPRSEVASAVVSRGTLRTNLTISFTDGGSWAFEVSPLIGRTVVRVADALGH